MGTQPPSDPPATGRQAWFDNARFVLLALVVVGHALEPLIDSSRAVRATYLAVYTFHMPLFVWLAGRYSTADLTPAHAGRLVQRVVLPLLVFQVLYTLFHHQVFATPELGLVFVRPYWILWFLLSLLWWRLLLPLFTAVRFGVLAAVGLALLAGRSDAIGYDLSLSRTVVFLPFFLLGHRMRDHDLPWLTGRPQRLAALAVLALLGTLAWGAAPHLDQRWLYGSVGYAVLGVGTGWQGMAGRLLAGLLAVVAGAAVLALVPRGRQRWSALGGRTLHGFLLHGFVVRGAVAAGWLGPERWTAATALTFLPLLGVGVAAVLCSQRVARATDWLVAPPVGRWLLGPAEPR